MNNKSDRPATPKSASAQTSVRLDEVLLHAVGVEAAHLGISKNDFVVEAIRQHVKLLNRQRTDWERRKASMQGWSEKNLEKRLEGLLAKPSRSRFEEIELRFLGHLLDERAASDESESYHVEYEAGDHEDFDCYDCAPEDITPAAIATAIP